MNGRPQTIPSPHANEEDSIEKSKATGEIRAFLAQVRTHHGAILEPWALKDLE